MSDGHRYRWVHYGGFCLTVMLCLFAFLASGLTSSTPTLPGNYSRTLTVNGVSRRYLLHVPRSRVFADRPLPLVMLLHGAGSDGVTVADATGMVALADREHFYLVCPDAAGTERKWNTEQHPAAADDVAFLSQLADQLCVELPIDRARCYLAGYSCGASMCATQALATPDRFAALGAVCGMIERSLALRTMRHNMAASPTPVLLIYGDEDPDIPYEKSTRYTSYPTRLPVHDTVRFWLDYNRCTPAPAVTALENGGVTVKEFAGVGAPVRLLAVHGGTHDWPGSTEEQLRTRPALRNLMLNTLWEFFQAQGRA